jgi:asparagine synthase (glutamine-hydrolysing)
MCGIAGAWGNIIPTEKQISSTLSGLKHRGPDDVGCSRLKTNNRCLTLLFTRLAIIDLDKRANQPMHFEGLSIIYNGEIYNYLELRSELEKMGVHFTTESDTEVLLKGIKIMGWKILDKIEGMWAIAVYDKRLDRLTLCRDRFGEKPLKYMKINNQVYFASEVEAIQKLSGIGLVPNEEHIKRFLVNGYKSLYKTKETFFNGIRDVPARRLVHIDKYGSVVEEEYWSPVSEIDTELDFRFASNQVEEKLTRSLELRLRSDVPVAFSLSGGVDSVALVSIARKKLGLDVNGFTIKNFDYRYDESELVKKVVKKLSINHTEIAVNKFGFLKDLEEIINTRKTPVLTLSSFVQCNLMKKISEAGYKVVIGGTAADEIFTGYYDHHLYYFLELNHKERVKAIANWTEKIKPNVQNPYLQNPNLIFTRPEFREYMYLDSEIYSSYLTNSWAEEFSEVKYSSSILRNRMLNELLVETVPVLLHEEDLNAMNYSIENRSPYLDKNLVEFMSKVPSNLLVREGLAKAILRESVKNYAPIEIMRNPRKIGFNVPIESLIDFSDQGTKKFFLSDSAIYEIINKKFIQEMIQKNNFDNSQSKFLFNFISSKIFLDQVS